MLLSLLSSLALFGGGGESPATGNGLHAVAFVTDSLSHGTLGDGLLSLNEAILLHNAQLSFQQLSPAEQAQVSLIPGTGLTTDVTWIDVDGTSTPVITIERDLDPILDTNFGLLIKGFNEPPIFDFSGPNVTHGFRAPANSVSFQDVTLFGGPYGVDVQQTDVAGQSGATFQNVRFEGQAQFALRVTTSTPNAIGRLILDNVEFASLPAAIVWDENVANRTTIFEASRLSMTNVGRGIDLTLGSGGTARYTFDRITMRATQSGLRLLRPNGANRTTLIEGQHMDIEAPDAARIEGAPTGVTFASLRMWHLVATTVGGTALHLGALGDSVYGEIEDCSFDGATSVFAGGTSQPLAIDNVRCRNGAVTCGTTASQPMTFAWSRFDHCAVQLAGSAAIPFTECCCIGGSLSGTVTAPAHCTDSYVQNAGSQVTQTTPRTQPQLGSMHLLPSLVTIGSTATFQADLPNGLFSVFLLGFTDPAPMLLPQPLHAYSQPAATFVVPGIFRLQQAFQWSVPNFQIFLGMDMVVSMAVLPDPNVGAPALQIVPGRRFVLR
jgi:hypothetical protein